MNSSLVYRAGGRGNTGHTVLFTAAGVIAAALVAYIIYEWVRVAHRRKAPSPASAPPPPSASAAAQASAPVGMAGGYGGAANVPTQSAQPNNVMGFFPYSSQVTSAYDYKFPESEQPQSLTKTDHLPAAIAQAAAGAGGSPYDLGYQLNAQKLMPSSWRGPQDCSAAKMAQDTTNWAKFAPTKEAFDNWITASSSARLGVNTRNSLVKVTGVRNLLRSPTAAPITARKWDMNDSSFRQDLIASISGVPPQYDGC